MPHSHKKPLVPVRDRLKSAGLKSTPQRLAILEFLQKKHGPFSPEEIFEGVKAQGMDRVTVYRNLPSLEKAGLLRRCGFGLGATRFEFQESLHSHHHHISCMKCHKVKTIDRCLLKKIESELKTLGYRNLSHSLEFFGVCPQCA